MPIGMEEYRTTAQRLDDAHDQIAALEAELSATNIALKASGAGYAALESEIADHKDLTFKSTVALRALEARCATLTAEVMHYTAGTPHPRIASLEAALTAALKGACRSDAEATALETPEAMHARIVTETADAIAKERGLTAETGEKS